MPQHPFPPLYDKNSKILILGSFPSVKSREQNFYPLHCQLLYVIINMYNFEIQGAKKFSTLNGGRK